MTGIEWTDVTWNPVTGCNRISPGCDNCYAATMAARLKLMGNPRYQNDGEPPNSGPGFAVTLHHDLIARPLLWRKPRRVFVCSMSDLFNPQVPDEFIRRVIATMADTPHTYQVLTKRSKRLAEFEPCVFPEDRRRWPANVWVGVSIESFNWTFRTEHLAHVVAPVRWVSAEPLIGSLAGMSLACIDWLVAGGESGLGARPCDPDWVRELREACEMAGVAFFFKQWGGRTPKANGRTLDGVIHDAQPPMHSQLLATTLEGFDAPN